MGIKILITGANGYIGSHVANLAYELGYDVVACDFSNSNLNPSIEFKNINILDLANNDDLYTKLGNPTHVIHFAWKDGFSHNAPSHIENLPKHFDFIKNLIDFGCKSISIMGTMHEIGYVEGIIRENTPCNPLNFYGIAKNALRQSTLLYAKDKETSIKWLRAYYIYGNDEKNHSIFTKLIQAEKEGKETFPFTDGTNFYDFIHIDELSNQILAATLQNEIDGIINVCSGKPVSLKDKVEEYLKEHNFKIKLNYGVFPKRQYDSPIVYGENLKITKILENYKKGINV